MTATRDWTQVKQLFHDALELPPGGRTAFVKARAASPEVFDEVMSLLQAQPAETRRVSASEANAGVAGRYLISLNKGVLVAQP